MCQQSTNFQDSTDRLETCPNIYHAGCPDNQLTRQSTRIRSQFLPPSRVSGRILRFFFGVGIPGGIIMASKMRFTEEMLKQNSNLLKFGHFYNIDSTVGENATNKRDDVMLIQFMLNTWMHSAISGFARSDGFVEIGEIPQDGKFDLTTLAFLIVFQMHRTGFIDVTGRMEPMEFYAGDGGVTRIPLSLHARESVFVVFRPSAPPPRRIVSVTHAGLQLWPLPLPKTSRPPPPRRKPSRRAGLPRPWRASSAALGQH